MILQNKCWPKAKGASSFVKQIPIHILKNVNPDDILKKD